MGETDISGLGLLEAPFRLDRAAERLDLTSSSTSSRRRRTRILRIPALGRGKLERTSP